MKHSRTLPYLVITFVVIIWGLSFLSIKVAVQALGPMTLALSRFTVASVILLTILKLREPDANLRKQDIPLMTISSIVGITLYFFFENYGVKLTTASTASIIIATIPVLTAIADYIFCGSRINAAKVAGITLSFVGVYFIVGDSGKLDFSSDYFTGNLFMLGAALSWVAYSLTTRRLGRHYSNLSLTTYQTLLGTVAIIPFALFEKSDWSAVDGTIIANVLFLAIFCSAAGYFLYIYTIGKLGVSITTLFINLIPVVTVVGSYFIIGEKISPTQMLGGGIIICAVYIADINTWFKKPQRIHRASSLN